MEKEKKLTSENVIVKPTAEEVAFETFKSWFNWERVLDYSPDVTMNSVNCGIARVDVFRMPIGLLVEIWPSGNTPVKGWKSRRDGLYHLWPIKNADDISELPSDFKQWFLGTIDRMYGWK